MGKVMKFRPKNKNVFHCHKMIKATAIEFAGAHYEILMKDDVWWTSWKQTHPDLQGSALLLKWCELSWPAYVGQARTTLAQLLGGSLDDAIKDEIHEALLLDSTVPRRGHTKPLFRT